MQTWHPWDPLLRILIKKAVKQLKRQNLKVFQDLAPPKKLPKKIPKKMKLLYCVGCGSSAMGFWNEFMDTDAEFIGIEAGGPKNSKYHAAPLTNGSKI